MFKDCNGVELSTGSYVHYKRSKDNPYNTSENSLDDFDGWVFIFGGVMFLFTNDVNNNLYYVGLYWDLDNDPCWEIEKI